MTTRQARKGTRIGDGQLIRDLVTRAVLAGKTTAQVIRAVRRSFPDATASASASGVAWWKADMRQRGLDVQEGA